MSLHLVSDLQANYDHFVAGACANGEVWGLKTDEGWAVCPSNEYECDVYLFWSDETYAQQHCNEEWSSYVPTSIPLENFLEHWIPGMERDEVLVGVQFNADMAGLEVEPSQLAQDLRK